MQMILNFGTSKIINKMKNQIDILLPCIKKRKKTTYNSLGYHSIPSGNDIYNKFRKVKDSNPANIPKNKESAENDRIKARHEKYLLDEMCGNYLDMPGSEFDDEE
jgi:hypothetical protein